MVKPNTSMKIYIVKSEEQKNDQHWEMLWYCIDHWSRLNNKSYSDYTNLMNMETYRYNDEHDCFVAKTYCLKLNKW